MVTIDPTPPPGLDRLTREADFQTLVVGTLRLMGWVVIDLKDARVDERGIPDLLCFRAGRGELIELKIGTRPLSAGQKRWRDRWLPDDTPCHLIRNSDADWRRMMAIMGPVTP